MGTGDAVRAEHEAFSATRAAGFSRDVVVVGGCGRVGLPLAIALADRGAVVGVHDRDRAAVDQVNAGLLPFREPGAAELLARVVAAGRLRADADPGIISSAETVVVAVGTPIDEHLNPDPSAIPEALRTCITHFRNGQLVVLRSTVFPGVTALVEKTFAAHALAVDTACCPERSAEGRATTELCTLPQLVGGCTPRATARAARLFRLLTKQIVDVTPEEAEVAKLFANAWRYIKFAAANQLYMMANDQGLDYERLRTALTLDYPRAADLPGAGLTAGPCLLKDTMQLMAWADNNFTLGATAMQVNEGLPLHLASRLERAYDLARLKVGILGMAFKGESDDIRSSLAYKLKRVLAFKAAAVLCTDPYVQADPGLRPLDEVLEEADILVIAAPHAAYRDLHTHKPVVDIWKNSDATAPHLTRPPGGHLPTHRLISIDGADNGC
jgi:UDP-N-acetyl-D-mannosaminuronic acid dehydrogenase